MILFLLIELILLDWQYYMRTGTCKFGASCKFHHPRQGGGSISSVSLNYYGYPLRQVCFLVFMPILSIPFHVVNTFHKYAMKFSIFDLFILNFLNINRVKKSVRTM